MRVVMVDKGAQTPNPNDMAAGAFIRKFKAYDSTAVDVQPASQPPYTRV